MSFSILEKEVLDYCQNNDFVSNAVIDDFRERLNAEGNLATLSFELKSFVGAACPNCGSAGYFKWHFLGKLIHPDCGWAWYVGPGKYIAEQLKAVFRTGMEIGVDTSEPNKKGEGGGFIGGIFGFFMGVCFRLPFAALMIPIQAIVSLAQKKPDQNHAEEAQSKETTN